MRMFWTRRGQVLVNTVFFAVAPGTPFRGIVTRRIVAGSQASSHTAMAFVLSSWTFSNPLCFYPLPERSEG